MWLETYATPEDFVDRTVGLAGEDYLGWAGSGADDFVLGSGSKPMYAVDDLDTVIELHDIPRPDTGAPLPVVLSDEHDLQLAYIVSEPDPNWDGSNPKLISAESPDMLIAIVRFSFPDAHTLGPPNDEAFMGHPLAKRGLAPYRVFEVKQSSWIRRLERMNSVHPMHDERFFESTKHFIFAFHDSTFECIADGFEVQVSRGSIHDALAKMVGSLKNRK